MSRQVWLSFPLGMSDPRPPAIPAPSLTPLYTVAKDGADVQTLVVASHTGTHLDAPRHVIADGLCIADFSIPELMFTQPVVLDLPLADAAVAMPGDLEPMAAALRDADLALFRFGYGCVRREEPGRFSTRCPGFGVASARWIRQHAPNLRAMGMDVPSVACIASLEETMPAHHELLGGPGRRFLIIEDMNLEQDLAGLRQVRVCPWLVRGMDSGPCSAIGTF
jgi:arylformamidase